MKKAEATEATTNPKPQQAATEGVCQEPEKEIEGYFELTFSGALVVGHNDNMEGCIEGSYPLLEVLDGH